MQLPVDHLNAELRRMGRSLDGATILSAGWKRGEYGLQILWPDGHCQFLGMGPVATDAIVAGVAANDPDAR